MKLVTILFFLLLVQIAFGQQVPIQSYTVDVKGQVRLEVNSTSGKYYLLQVKHHPDSAFALATSMTLGQTGTTIITEPLRAYPLNHYQVLEYDQSNPMDSDQDGTNDLEEFNAMPSKGPLNAAPTLSSEHALVTLNTIAAFHTVSTEENGTPWVEYLNDVEYTKFIILDFYTTQPKIYFINSNNYDLHADFAAYLGINHLSPTLVKGQLIYNPHILSSNGTLGTYAFNFTNNEAKPFAVVQRTQELLAANMPYLSNNLSYFITENNEQDYQDNSALYQNSRVPVLFESDVYAGINYWGLHQAEGYGFFRLMAPGEVPDSRDIVLYEALPNSLPRVGGIISSVIQTPLSHVNLRAIHDNVPNAFIRDPLLNDSISNLLGHYIYFKTNQSSYELREATLEEVNAWFESKRPANEQTPPLNLSYKSILPLDAISFGMYDGFGAKVANVATMRTFGFPEGTIPDGFGVPFYFYQEFMKYNGFFDEITSMMQDSSFMADRNVRDTRLETLRDAIEDANMPAWMMDSLTIMQNSFPSGTSIRSRSSTNNEDLPGFSGAGLYDSKTHHPDEGHISKTIKEVYASLWNLRAFEEREFYRVNHFKASMGVLCHPNFDDEQVNGVGVSADPVYNTENTFYLNSQLGEELITNPENTYPEELLLKRYPDGNDNYSVIQYSSLLDVDTLLMNDVQLDLLRQYLSVIHDRFALLYNAVGNSTFAMDIEYKIDSTNQLVIKQARPWVSYVPSIAAKPVGSFNCNFALFPNPAQDLIHIACEDCGIVRIRIADMKGSLVLDKIMEQAENWNPEVSIGHLQNGLYFISGFMDGAVCKTLKFIKH
ncbi:PEP/pyruvate-binding domain-containing protein [Fluviicola sp.]|uniref:PEP/pyruvate-binding domain-containing protein n=1 Tax=Fluviicola sp. TaxID=1917219 RepID=UPI0031CECF8C